MVAPLPPPIKAWLRQDLRPTIEFAQWAAAIPLFPTPSRAGDMIYWTGSTWAIVPGNNTGATAVLQETAAGVASFAALSSGGTLVSIQTFSASATITIPAGATKAFVRMWGGSGGSGGVDTSVNGTSGSTGAGGYLEKYLTGLTPALNLTWTQGAAGAAGSNAPGNGGNGGASTLASGTQIIATLTANGSNGSLASTGGAATAGTAGGTSSGGDFNAPAVAGNSAGTSRNPGSPGMNLYCPGAFGALGAGSAIAGIAGNPGGLIIFWFA